LLGILTNWQPPKAKAKPAALFFDGVCVGDPKEGTGCGTVKPAGTSFAWTPGETLRQELGPWWMLPW